MIQRSILAMVITCLLFSNSLAATNNKPTAKTEIQPRASVSSAVNTQSSKQWEYLVVSFGKTLYTDPDDNPETKTIGLSKLLSYSKAGVVSAKEALSTQNQMDTLGKFGWELIDVLGSIGGDQQMVFRRHYDAEQSKKEAVLIREEGERLLAAQQEAASKLARSTKETSAEIVDLDAVERAIATNETRRKEEARLKEAINTIKSHPISNVKVISTAYAPDASNVASEIEVDGSTFLLKENKYRSSEAKAMASQIAQSIYNAANLGKDWFDSSPPSSNYYSGEVKISVSVKVTYQGTSKIVATQNIGGKWDERAKRR